MTKDTLRVKTSFYGQSQLIDTAYSYQRCTRFRESPVKLLEDCKLVMVAHNVTRAAFLVGT